MFDDTVAQARTLSETERRRPDLPHSFPASELLDHICSGTWPRVPPEMLSDADPVHFGYFYVTNGMPAIDLPVTICLDTAKVKFGSVHNAHGVSVDDPAARVLGSHDLALLIKLEYRAVADHPVLCCRHDRHPPTAER